MRAILLALALTLSLGLLETRTLAEEQVAEATPASESDAGRSSAETGGAAPAMEAGTYSVRLRDLEQRINELKEQIFRSKARLSLLAETVLEGAVVGSQAVIAYEDKMSPSFRLVQLVVALDGAPLFSRADDEGGIVDGGTLQVFHGAIVPGEHTLTVSLEFQGHGYGMFTYLKGYRFKVRSSYSFIAPEGRAITVRVVGYEQGGPSAPLEERPALRFVERVEDRVSELGDREAE